jgi:hypothetical protein
MDGVRRPNPLPLRLLWVACRYPLGSAGRQQCDAYPTLMAECRQGEGQRPLGGVTLQAAVGHQLSLATGSFLASCLIAVTAEAPAAISPKKGPAEVGTRRQRTL